MGVRSKVLHLYCQKAWVNRFWDIIKSTRERALLSIYLSYALCAHLPVHFVILKTYNAILSEIIQTLTTKCSKTETFSLGVGDFEPFEHFFSLHILSISSKYTWANGGHNRNKSGQEEIMSIHFFLLFDILHRLSLCTYTYTHTPWYSLMFFLFRFHFTDFTSCLCRCRVRAKMLSYFCFFHLCDLRCFFSSLLKVNILLDLAIMSHFYNPLWLSLNLLPAFFLAFD